MRLNADNGKTPVRISQRPSKINPRFLPARLFVKAIVTSFKGSINREMLVKLCPLLRRSVYSRTARPLIKKRTHHQTRFQRRLFVAPPAAVSLRKPFGRRNREFDILREFQRYRVAVVFQDLQ